MYPNPGEAIEVVSYAVKAYSIAPPIGELQYGLFWWLRLGGSNCLLSPLVSATRVERGVQVIRCTVECRARKPESGRCTSVCPQI